MIQVCPCGFDSLELTRFGVDWHRQHKAHHLWVYPNVADDRRTIENLDSFTARAERLGIR